MRRIRIAPILAAALLFVAVMHHHPAGATTAANPCSVCVHDSAADLGESPEVVRPGAWAPLVVASDIGRADAEAVPTITRGPPAA